jgi:AcrR family transcriptional regulator
MRMAKLFSLFRRTRRRIKSGLLDHSAFKLYEAAERLLQDHDHEQISVAQLTLAAGVSVGAFYRRYRDKDAFLRMVVGEYLYSTRNRMERALARERWARQPAHVVTRAIVEHLMRDLQGPPGAGIVRAALKCGHLDRGTLAPLVSYRSALADRAVALLAHRANNIPRAERTVRARVQITVATVLDALLHDGDILRSGSQRMADALSTMMLDGLGLSVGQAGKAPAEHDEPDMADDNAMLAMPITELVAVEIIPETTPARRRSAQRRAAPNPDAKPIPVIDPKHVSAEVTEKPEPPPPPRGRYRPRF